MWNSKKELLTVFKKNKSGGGQKGISVLLTVLIMSVILSIALGISAIFIQQTKMMGEIGYSVVSFYAADTGIERELYDLFKSSTPQPQYSETLSNNATFNVIAKCSAANPACPLPPPPFTVDPDCNASNYCIKSVGSYQKTRRAIETSF